MFFSAVLAGYFAWRTVRSSPEDEASPPDPAADAKSRAEDGDSGGLRKVRAREGGEGFFRELSRLMNFVSVFRFRHELASHRIEIPVPFR